MFIDFKDLRYAVEEIRKLSQMYIVYCEWEEYLKEYNPLFWRYCFELLKDASRREVQNPDDDDALFVEFIRIRMMLTVVYGTVYSARGKSLPSLLNTTRVQKYFALSQDQQKAEIERHLNKFFSEFSKFALFPMYAHYKPEGVVVSLVCAFECALIDACWDEEGVSSDDEPDSEIAMMPMSTDVRTTISGMQEIRNEKTSFDEVGGQVVAKTQMIRLAAALNNPEHYTKWGTRPPRGVGLVGPPGNGKTLLARALAASVKMPFYAINMSDVLSMWFAESEKNIDKIFKKARKTGGVLFFDEVDDLAPSRANSFIHEASRRVVATLNRNMDGFVQTDRVVVVFATNRKEDLDEAFLRAGRIDRIIEVPLPDMVGRREIFSIHMQKAEHIAEHPLFDTVDVNCLTARSDMLSGADIAEVVRRTLEEKVIIEDTGSTPGRVTTNDMLCELERYEHARDKRMLIGFAR